MTAPSLTLVAVSKEGYQAASVEMLGWLRAQVQVVTKEREDQAEIREVARKRGWDLAAFNRTITRADKSIRWYESIIAAIVAGYAILPNLPMRVFAIRRDAAKGVRGHDRIVDGEVSTWNRDPAPAVEGHLLPPGTGDYTSENPMRQNVATYRDEPEGGKEKGKLHRHYRTVDVAGVEFPVQMLRPELIEATDLAISSRIFDEIGLVVAEGTGGRHGDPLIVGRIWRDNRRQRAVCFNIGWFINLADLR